MEPRQSHLTGHYYYIGNDDMHSKHRNIDTSESDSDERSNHPSLSDLIPRVAESGSDSDSDKESKWMMPLKN